MNDSLKVQALWATTAMVIVATIASALALAEIYSPSPTLESLIKSCLNRDIAASAMCLEGLSKTLGKRP